MTLVPPCSGTVARKCPSGPATALTTTLVSLDAVGWPAEITTVLPARAVPLTRMPLHVAHWISVQDGKEQGLSEAELLDDENLLVLCAKCKAATHPLPLTPSTQNVQVRPATSIAPN